MKQKMNYTILGGMVIGLGAMFFITTGKSYAFTLGILAIVSLELPLITGYLPWATYNKTLKTSTISNTLLGNIIGAGMAGTWICSIPKGKMMCDRIQEIVATKNSMSAMELINSGMITGLLIAIGVIAYNKQKGNFLGIVMLLMSVTAFVALGTDHIVANAFYVVADGTVHYHDSLRLLFYSGLGNAIGGIFTGLGIYAGGK